MNVAKDILSYVYPNFSSMHPDWELAGDLKEYKALQFWVVTYVGPNTVVGGAPVIALSRRECHVMKISYEY